MTQLRATLVAALLATGLASCQTGELADARPATYENCEGAFTSVSGTDMSTDGNTEALYDTLDVCSSRERWEEIYMSVVPGVEDPQAAADAFEETCQRPELAEATLCAQAASGS